MHYVIHLNLGSEAEEQIRLLWRSLADQGISPRELALNGTPHVTVMSSAPFRLAGITKNLASLARQFEPFEITFSQLRDFSGMPGCAFSWCHSHRNPTSLHRRLYDLVSPTAEVFDFARPDVFVFHCTLGYILQPQDLPRAVELVFGASLPRNVRVRGFDVVECGETTSRNLTTYAFSE